MLKREFWRKGVHAAGIFFVPVLLWNRNVFAALALVFLTIYLFIEWLARKNGRFPWLSTLTEKCKRDSERGRLSKSAIFLVAACLLAPYLFGIRAAAVGLSQIFVADAAAALAGMTWGRKKLPFSPGKSWVGFFAFFLAAFAVGLLFVPPEEAAVLALIGAAVESSPLGEWDNLAVPLAVALAAFIWAPA